MTPGEREKNGIRSLPADLHEAIEAMEADGLIMDTLGKHASRSLSHRQKAGVGGIPYQHQPVGGRPLPDPLLIEQKR